MKKLISIVLAALIFALVMTSCGGEAKTPTPTADEVKGTNNGSIYTNEYTGLHFAVTGMWEFLTDEQMEQITGVTQDVLDEAGSGQDISAQIYDMMAMDSETANNVNILVQVLGDTFDGTLDEILNASEVEIKEMGESIGASYDFSDHTTVYLSGIEFRMMTASADFNGVSFTQGCYVAIVDGVSVNVTITSYDGTPLSDIEAMFNTEV